MAKIGSYRPIERFGDTAVSYYWSAGMYSHLPNCGSECTGRSTYELRSES